MFSNKVLYLGPQKRFLDLNRVTKCTDFVLKRVGFEDFRSILPSVASLPPPQEVAQSS